MPLKCNIEACGLKNLMDRVGKKSDPNLCFIQTYDTVFKKTKCCYQRRLQKGLTS